jgi:hypothetical protein
MSLEHVRETYSVGAVVPSVEEQSEAEDGYRMVKMEGETARRVGKLVDVHGPSPGPPPGLLLSPWRRCNACLLVSTLHGFYLISR